MKAVTFCLKSFLALIGFGLAVIGVGLIIIGYFYVGNESVAYLFNTSKWVPALLVYGISSFLTFLGITELLTSFTGKRIFLYLVWFRLIDSMRYCLLFFYW